MSLFGPSIMGAFRRRQPPTVAHPDGSSHLTAVQWVICAIAAIGFAFDTYEVVVMSLVVEPALTQLGHLQPGSPAFNQWVGLLFHVPAAAGGIFGLLGGYLADRLGRRRVLVWSILLYALSAVAAAYSTSLAMLLALRCTAMIGVSIEFVAAVAWLAELFPAPKHKPLHHPGLAHAFLNTLLFLDYDRAGFPWPVLAFQVNCYGRRVIAQRGGRGNLAAPLGEEMLDPPSPTPLRCMEVGAATARAIRQSPWRVALIASASWSHAFLTDKHHQLYPDVESDRRLYDALCRGDYETWRRTPLAALEDGGQQEMLNWFMLVGAMDELGRKPDQCHFIETWSFNSNKCFAVFEP